MSNQNQKRATPNVARRLGRQATKPVTKPATKPQPQSQSQGLRERKKLQTRLAISQVATALFIERGYEDVTMAEVAQAADVSVNTVFNYFATKEELFFDRGEAVVDEPSRVVRERRVGESAVTALRRAFRKLTRGDHATLIGQRIRPFLVAIEASPALKAHARLLMERTEERLCATLIEETAAPSDDPTARSVAALAVGLESMLVKAIGQGVFEGVPDDKLRAQIGRLGERGFELLLEAARDYCVRV